MYLINTKFKPSKATGWKRLCEIYVVSWDDVVNVTAMIADEQELYFDAWFIIIPFWSGTGYMRLSEMLREEYNASRVKDLSI